MDSSLGRAKSIHSVASKLAFTCLIYVAWRERNFRIYQSTSRLPHILQASVVNLTSDRIRSHSRLKTKLERASLLIASLGSDSA